MIILGSLFKRPSQDPNYCILLAKVLKLLAKKIQRRELDFVLSRKKFKTEHGPDLSLIFQRPNRHAISHLFSCSCLGLQSTFQLFILGIRLSCFGLSIGPLYHSPREPDKVRLIIAKIISVPRLGEDEDQNNETEVALLKLGTFIFFLLSRYVTLVLIYQNFFN